MSEPDKNAEPCAFKPGNPDPINGAYQQMHPSVGEAVAIGIELMAAKEKLKHGEWLPWLRANVKFSPRTAQV